MINVLLVDDHSLIHIAVKKILSEVNDILLIGEVHSGEEALRFVKQEEPDVVIMDVDMPGMGGIEATKRLNKLYPNIKVLGLSAYEDDHHSSMMLNSGAKGYLTKDCVKTEIIKAIRVIYSGKPYITHKIAQNLVSNGSSENEESPLAQLSRRELQIMKMVA